MLYFSVPVLQYVAKLQCSSVGLESNIDISMSHPRRWERHRPVSHYTATWPRSHIPHCYMVLKSHSTLLHGLEVTYHTATWPTSQIPHFFIGWKSHTTLLHGLEVLYHTATLPGNSILHCYMAWKSHTTLLHGLEVTYHTATWPGSHITHCYMTQPLISVSITLYRTRWR